MNFFDFVTSSPLMIILFIYAFFWLFVTMATLLSRKARDFFSTFYPQWFKREGRSFTTREKIGASFQAISLLIIVSLLLL